MRQIIDNALGLAIPIRSLKSDDSIGCGEFLDLILLADFVKQSGLKIIQILPINDTGSDPSPYMALSSIALHPIYISIKELDSENACNLEIEKLSQDLANNNNYNYILDRKISLVKDIFMANRNLFLSDKDFIKFFNSNKSWLKPYAVFKTLKDTYNQASFKEWQVLTKADSKDINSFYKTSDCDFYSWLQFVLARQLSKASSYIKEQGLILKGDIPIMMNEDSVDVWFNSHLFSSSLVAGAPPDHYNEEGQRWGFPCYDWDAHESQNFSWWKERLSYASNFFNAYRIDHVLGFFRIWATNRLDYKATLGFFNPVSLISKDDLNQIGFDDSRIKWFLEPHIFGYEIISNFAEEASSIIDICFVKLNNEDIYCFNSKIKYDSDIFNLVGVSDSNKNKLYRLFLDRALVQVGDKYSLAWFFKDGKAYKSLNEDKIAFDDLVIRLNLQNENLWQGMAKKLLSVLVKSSTMIVCAEDLGVVPKCVAPVLSSLNILSLKVLRWTKINDDYNNHIFADISEYTPLSVATLSVHDSSVSRFWWDSEEPNKALLLDMLEIDKDHLGDKFNVNFASLFLRSYIIKNSAKWIILPLQDFFALSDKYIEDDPSIERINIPGTLAEGNWSYRIKPNLNSLIKDINYIQLLKSLSRLKQIKI